MRAATLLAATLFTLCATDVMGTDNCKGTLKRTSIKPAQFGQAPQAKCTESYDFDVKPGDSADALMTFTLTPKTPTVGSITCYSGSGTIDGSSGRATGHFPSMDPGFEEDGFEAVKNDDFIDLTVHLHVTTTNGGTTISQQSDVTGQYKVDSGDFFDCGSSNVVLIIVIVLVAVVVVGAGVAGFLWHKKKQAAPQQAAYVAAPGF